MNSIQLAGRLVNDVTFTQNQDGSLRCNYTVAVDRPVKRTNGKQMTADFFDCTAFGNVAKAANTYQQQYNGYRKGDYVTVCGRGEFDVYQDRRTGQTVRRFQVVVNEHSCVSRKNPAPQQGGSYTPPEYQAPVYEAPGQQYGQQGQQYGSQAQQYGSQYQQSGQQAQQGIFPAGGYDMTGYPSGGYR